MFLFTKRLSDQKKQELYDKLRKSLKYDRIIRPVTIDFTKPWYSIFFVERRLLLLNILHVAVFSSFEAAFPILIGVAVATGDFRWLVYLVFAKILERLVVMYLSRFHPMYQITMERSIGMSAFRRLLVVDPIHHTTRSSGQIISKISRGRQGVYTVLDVIIFSVLPVLFSAIAISIALSQVSIVMSFGLILGTSVFVIFNYWMYQVRSDVTGPTRILAEDKVQEIAVESIQQAQYIRATYGTQQYNNDLFDHTSLSIQYEAVRWRWGYMIMYSTQFVFFICYLAAGWYLWNLGVDKAVLIGLLAAMYSFGYLLFELGRILDGAIKAAEDVADLYSFIREFGMQTYPIFESNSQDLSPSGDSGGLRSTRDKSASKSSASKNRNTIMQSYY